MVMESEHTSAGRRRSTQFDMYLRADVLEHHFAGLDQISNSPRRWPGGNLWYLYGAEFIGWIVDTYGPNTFSAVASDYGATSGILIFEPTQVTKLITVAVNGNLVSEADETFKVLLSTPTNADIAVGQGNRRTNRRAGARRPPGSQPPRPRNPLPSARWRPEAVRQVQRTQQRLERRHRTDLHAFDSRLTPRHGVCHGARGRIAEVTPRDDRGTWRSRRRAAATRCSTAARRG